MVDVWLVLGELECSGAADRVVDVPKLYVVINVLSYDNRACTEFFSNWWDIIL